MHKIPKGVSIGSQKQKGRVHETGDRTVQGYIKPMSKHTCRNNFVFTVCFYDYISRASLIPNGFHIPLAFRANPGRSNVNQKELERGSRKKKEERGETVVS